MADWGLVGGGGGWGGGVVMEGRGGCVAARKQAATARLWVARLEAGIKNPSAVAEGSKPPR